MIKFSQKPADMFNKQDIAVYLTCIEILTTSITKQEMEELLVL